jgi:hypothetical protein
MMTKDNCPDGSALSEGLGLVPERWVVVRQTVLDVGFGDDVRTGGRPALGYSLIENAATFGSEDEARTAIQDAALPIGWVFMPLSRLLQDLYQKA